MVRIPTKFHLSSFNFNNLIFQKERKVQNDTIRAAMEVGKNMLEVMKEKMLMIWTYKQNATKQTAILEWEPEGDPTKEG